MILLLILFIFIIVGIFFLIFKTGGFLLDGFTSLINRIINFDSSDFTSSEIMVIIVLIIACLISFSTLMRIINKYNF